MFNVAFLLLTLAIPPSWADDPLTMADTDDVAAGGGSVMDDDADGNAGGAEDPMRAFGERLLGTTSAIINGESASSEDYPMAGGMLMDATYRQGAQSMDFRVFLCSSTLIAPDVVLLAAHCLDEYSITGGYGTLTINEIGWTRQADLSALADMGVGPLPAYPDDTVMAWDWVRNQQYTGQFQLGLSKNYDVGLLFLDTPITDVPHAYLATEAEIPQIVEGIEVEAVGWGQQTSDTNPPTGTYAYKQMGLSYIAELGPWEFQVGLLPTDVRKCHGVSGGPSFLCVETEEYTENMRLIGVTSHAYDMTDCRQTGGVDTRIDYYFDWIEDEMSSRCADGTRAWCDEPGIVLPPVPIPVDTGDTGLDDDDSGKNDKKCGCATSEGPRSVLPWFLLLALVPLRRRVGRED